MLNRNRKKYLVKADFTDCDSALPLAGVRWFGLDGVHDAGGLRPFDTAMMAHCYAIGFDAALAFVAPGQERPSLFLEQAIAAPADVQRQIACDDEGVSHE